MADAPRKYLSDKGPLSKASTPTGYGLPGHLQTFQQQFADPYAGDFPFVLEDTRSAYAMDSQPTLDYGSTGKGTPMDKIMHDTSGGIYFEVFGRKDRDQSVSAFRRNSNTRQLVNDRLPIYVQQPLANDQRSLLDRVYLQYRNEARSWLAAGVLEDEIIHPERVLVDLCFRERTPTDPFYTSYWASELMRPLQLSQFTTLACIGHLTRLMDWLVKPTAQSYERVPVSIRPTLEQRLIPHTPCVDLIPFPAARNCIIENTEDFTELLRNNVFCDWPHDMDEAVHFDAMTYRWCLKPEFETFANDLRNWSVTAALARRMPEIVTEDHVRVRD